nr:PREDICTED: 33 kDa inner dynein arm light chain, axonemal [Bemisia tabaci]
MGERTLVSQHTLVKYGNPVLVTKKRDKSPYKCTPGPSTSSDKRGAVGGVERDKDTEDILNCILPPREWEQDGQLWIQQVSSDPATRLDVLKLAEQLDMRLQQRQARETGICPVRRELFTQCFDELIRQVTINCAERGLLLLRVRDELRMTAVAYQKLYESSIAFGIRKALYAEQGKEDMAEKVEQLTAEKNKLQLQVVDLKAKADMIERRAKELRLAEEKQHAEEISFLRRANQQLKVRKI